MKRTIQIRLLCLGVFLILRNFGLDTVSAQTLIGTEINGVQAGDEYGRTVALSSDGQTMAVGAPLNDGNGQNSGQVQVFRWDGSAWAQLGSDIYGTAGDLSGRSLSMSDDGETVAVGSPYNNASSSAGVVRVYRWNGSTWSQLGSNIVGEAANNESGWSVSLSADGETVAIGAHWNTGGANQSGHVRVYRWSGSAWNQMGSDIDGESALDEFGRSVSLSSDGETIAIGIPFDNNSNGADAGQVRIYQWNGGSWVQLGGSIEGEGASDYFGFSVSLSSDGEILAIGAPYNNNANGSNAGQVRVYEWNGASWTQLGATLIGENADDNGGWSVSLSATGKVLAIGSVKNSEVASGAGQVRVFRWNGSSWAQIGNDLNGEDVDDQFGYSVGIGSDGTTLVVGAPGVSGGGTIAGYVKVFSIPVPCIPAPILYYRPSSFGQNNISTNGGSDGSIRTLVRNGTAPYTYTWTGPSTATGANPTSLKAGSYFLHVEDSEGCEGTAGPWNLREP